MLDSESELLPGDMASSGVEAVVVPSAELPGEASAFEAVVLGPRGPLGARAADVRSLRNAGYLGAIVGICVDPREGRELLDAGGDDFVVAPYQVVELVTRLNAVASRTSEQSRLRWGDMVLDRVGRVVHLDGKAVGLTEREAGILSCLMLAGGDVVSRATLRERVWQRKEDRGTNLVEVHLSRLREKLGNYADSIETVRRMGYRLRR
jgi:two-component system OmpR family response regulator